MSQSRLKGAANFLIWTNVGQAIMNPQNHHEWLQYFWVVKKLALFFSWSITIAAKWNPDINQPVAVGKIAWVTQVGWHVLAGRSFTIPQNADFLHIDIILCCACMGVRWGGAIVTFLSAQTLLQSRSKSPNIHYIGDPILNYRYFGESLLYYSKMKLAFHYWTIVIICKYWTVNWMKLAFHYFAHNHADSNNSDRMFYFRRIHRFT